jgi:uncharacterized protein YoxC
MSVSDVLAVAAIVIVAIFVGALATTLLSLTRTLRELRGTIDALRGQALPLLGEVRDAARAAGDEVERVDRLVTSAERLEDAVDSAGKLAYRTFANPVVKVMAVGTGVSRAAQRLRSGDPQPADTRSERRRRGRRAS